MGTVLSLRSTLIWTKPSGRLTSRERTNLLTPPAFGPSRLPANSPSTPLVDCEHLEQQNAALLKPHALIGHLSSLAPFGCVSTRGTRDFVALSPGR